MRRSTLLVPFLLLAACADTHDAVIQPSLAPCTGVASQLCMLVSENGGAPSLFYDSIEGFSFRWGTEATVRYSIEEIDNPPADGSSLRYRLEQTVNVELDDPGTTYELTFRAAPVDDDWFGPDTAGPGTVDMVGTRVACDQAICDQLLAGSSSTTRVTFELTSTPLTPLRAVAVVR